jgi:hypothetical protein
MDKGEDGGKSWIKYQVASVDNHGVSCYNYARVEKWIYHISPLLYLIEAGVIK